MNEFIYFEDEKKIVDVNIYNGEQFKILIDGLNDLFQEINLKFREDGIKLLLNNSKIYADIKLIKIQYIVNEQYNYLFKKDISIKIKELYDILNGISHIINIINIYIDEDDKHNLGIKINNKIYKIKIIKTNINKINNLVYYHVNMELSSIGFYKVCLYLKGEKLKIKCSENNVIFKGENNTKLIIYDNKKNIKNPRVIKGLYDIGKIDIYKKYSKLSENINIYMNMDIPNQLIIKYFIGDLGRIYIVIY